MRSEVEMGTVDRELEHLFSLVDDKMACCPDEVRHALETIIEREPSSARAWRLLEVVDADRVVEDPLLLVIEAAESLAAKGLGEQAREVADFVSRRYGESEMARVWLGGLELLLES